MIDMRIQPPAPRPAPAQAPARGARETSDFDDAMRDQETVAAPEKDEATDESVIPAASGATAAAVAPAALDTLLAQMLPDMQPKAARSEDAEPEDTKATRAPAADGALDLAGDVAADAPVVAPKHGKVGGLHDLPPDPDEKGKSSSDVFAQQDSPVHGARGRHGAETEPHGAAVRTVAVRSVSSAQHFPVVADPVRQIATEVTRALEAPAAAAAPDPLVSNVKTLNVQLEPESLGTVTLRLRLSGNQLSVRVDVAEPATLEMIQRERDRLQKSMTSESVSIDRLEIRAAQDAAPVTAGDNANATRQESNPQGQASRQNDNNGAGNGAQQRRETRGEPPTGREGRHGQDNDSTRDADSRGVYL